jgi:M6 family metalloprotease-like protein
MRKGQVRASVLTGGAVLGVLAAAVALAPRGEARPDAVETVAGLDEFGAPAAPAAGARPLLTILMHFSDQRFALTHNRPSYRRLLFGERSSLVGRVAGEGGFFDENSQGRFYYRNAGVYGPFTHPDNPATPIDESTYACASNGGPTCTVVGQDIRSNAIRRADAAGFPFSDYDADRDGRVTTEELTILMIFAEPPTGPRQGGQARALPCIPVSGGKQVCTNSIGVGEGAGAATIAHELTHMFNGPFGIDHVYGTRSRLNLPYSVFAGTINVGVDDDHRIWHLDPYTKLRLGWLEPRVLPITDSRCLRLRASALAPETGPRATPQAYLLYDPARGTREYFLVEHRLPLDLNYDGDPFRAGSIMLPDQGLAVWYVRTDASGALLTVQPYDLSVSGSDPTLYLLPSRGTPGRPHRFFGGLWDASHGDVAFRELDLTGARPTWADYHLDVGLRVASVSVRQAEIEILLNRTRSCAKPPKRPPIHRSSVPEVDDPPCARLSIEIRCVFRTPLFTLVRRTPAQPLAGGIATVRWTITPRRPLPAGLTVTDELPRGFRAPGGRPLVRFPALPPGKTLTRSYRLRSPQAAGGRLVTRSVVRFRTTPGGKPRRLSWRTALPIRSPRPPVGAPDPIVLPPAPPPPVPEPPPPAPEPPPPAPEPTPDLVVTDLTPSLVTVRNVGDAPAGSFVIRLTRTTDNGETSQDLAVGGLAAGASTTYQFACGSGTMKLEALADAQGQVDESNEGNNSKTLDTPGC